MLASNHFRDIKMDNNLEEKKSTIQNYIKRAESCVIQAEMQMFVHFHFHEDRDGDFIRRAHQFLDKATRYLSRAIELGDQSSDTELKRAWVNDLHFLIRDARDVESCKRIENKLEETIHQYKCAIDKTHAAIRQNPLAKPGRILHYSQQVLFERIINIASFHKRKRFLIDALTPSSDLYKVFHEPVVVETWLGLSSRIMKPTLSEKEGFVYKVARELEYMLKHNPRCLTEADKSLLASNLEFSNNMNLSKTFPTIYAALTLRKSAPAVEMIEFSLRRN